jgi:molybdenum cofactor sulfurtransferase
MREHALRAGASAAAVHLAHEPPAGWRVTPRGAEMRRGDAAAGLSPSKDDAPCLFALPAECNFSGARLDLGIVAALQQSPPADVAGVPAGRWAVLLDAAKAAATHPPDLSVVRPHFVALSYYKIFGYPTGLGALLVRADALPLLAARSYWGGGGFAAAAADADFVARHTGARGLEDGTAAFTAAVAVPRGAL